MKVLSLSIYLLVCGLSVHAQEPSYFTLGEKKFAGTDIYSILQGEDEKLYVACNDGLYQYKHGEFQQIPITHQQHGSSLFSLTSDKDGNVYCCNLSGQVFQLIDGKLELLLELDKEHIAGNVSVIMDQNDELIIASKDCFRYSQGKLNILYSSKGYINNLNKLPDGRVLVYSSTSDIPLIIDKDGLIPLDKDLDNALQTKSSITAAFFLANAKVFFHQKGEIEILSNSEIQNTVPQINKERYYQCEENEIWALDHSIGLRTLRVEDNRLQVHETIFQDKFISAITQGSNGSMLFGTFGQGLIVIPNRNIKKHKLTGSFEKLRGIASDENNNVFIAKAGGLIYYNGKETTANTSEVSAGKVFYTPGISYDQNSEFPSLIYGQGVDKESNSGTGTVKDVWQIDSTSVLVASSWGVYYQGNSLSRIQWESIGSSSWKRLPEIKERCKSVTCDITNSRVYYYTNKGLFVIDRDNNTREILFEEKSINGNDLQFFDNKLWCATQRDGILIFKDTVLQKQIDRNEGLVNSFVKKIEFNNNQLFISHKSGFQILDLKTNKLKTLGTAEGIINGYVNDFSFSKDKLWLLSGNAPFSIDLKDIPQNRPVLQLHLDSVLISGVSILEKEAQSLKHNQNHFAFHIEFRGLEYESEASIHYRINGLEEDWQKLPATAKLIEYKSLPDGEYTFEAEVRYRDMKSSPVNYSFQINQAFWQTWWFFILLAVALSSIVGAIAINRIREIRKANKESLKKQALANDLLETRLKALRSQMNPHFIFNSLNSIQDLILKKDTDLSYDYIVLFADLVRSTLSYSNVDFIPIEKELEFLKVYLSLEKLRFKDDFVFEIIYKGSKDLEVPSLIVQPFIENALQHGLLHKEGLKELTLEFEFDEKLYCRVIDNGIGREKAKEIQTRQGRSHDSFALEAIKKRLAILSKQYEKEVGYTVHDLYKDGEAIGTMVEITMPFRNRF